MHNNYFSKLYQKGGSASGGAKKTAARPRQELTGDASEDGLNSALGDAGEELNIDDVKEVLSNPQLIKILADMRLKARGGVIDDGGRKKK